MSLRVVGPALLAGLGISAAGWYLLTFIPFLSFFAAIFIGMAIGGAVSRVAKRRTNVYLEVGAVVDVVLGWMVAETVRSGGEMNWLLSSGRYSSIYVAIPLLFASYFAYTRVR